MPSIGTSAEQLASGDCLVQNLGPDALYLGRDESVDASSGVKVAAGDAVSVAYTSQPLHGVSVGTSDVRILEAGTGIFVAPAP